MDGNQNNTPELPVPQVNVQEKAPDAQEYSIGSSPEKQTSPGEGLTQQQPVLPQVASDDASQLAQPIGSSGVMPVDDASVTSQHAIADDADVIEKQWVERAKAIVTKTRSDPREQSRELSQFKAEYVKKRFSKELKVVEDAN